MNNGELIISAETLTRIFVVLLYAPIVLISYWKLMPRLSPTTKRIASGFLAAQVLVIAVSLETPRPASIYERWLWHLYWEWNIPSILASTQLALVGGVALTTAWFIRARSHLAMLYLLGAGLVFLYLGIDEFFAWKDFMRNLYWEAPYKLAGAAIMTATITIAIRSAKHMRIWHLCLLMGLALAAMGGLVVDDNYPGICGHLEFLHIDGCSQYLIDILEESLEFLGIWLALAAMLGHFSEVSPAVRVQRSLYALPALWILLLSQSAAILPIRVTLVANAQPAAVEFETDVHLYGFHIRSEYPLPRISIYLSPSRWDFNGLGYSVHLVDPISGESVASRHERTDRRLGYWVFGSDYAPLYRQRMELEIPPQAPANGVFWIVLTVWREKRGEFVRQKVLASDLQLLDDTQVILGELVIPTASAAQ